MAEEVNTGGVKRFVHSRGEQPKINEELRKDIRDAYGLYYERKARAEKRRKLLWRVAGLAIFLLIVFVTWKLMG
jgi:type IV secretory pathway component VirB8